MAERNRNFERGPRRRDRGEQAGQERAWEEANRRRQEREGPGEPGNWQDRDRYHRAEGGWQDRNRETWHSDWQERERSGQSGSWQGQGDVDYRRRNQQEDRIDFRNQGRDWRDMGDWAERQRVWEESGGWQSERGDLPEEQGPNRRQDHWQEDAGWQRDDWRRQRGNWENRQGSEWRERQEPNRRQDAGWQGNRASGQGQEGSRVGWERQQDNWRGKQRDDWRRQDDWRQQEDDQHRQREDEWHYRQRGPGEAWNEHRVIRGEREEWQNRQRGGPGGNWQERARREGWFARDDRESQDRRPEDSFGNENFYANRGWTRPSSSERDRDWGYYRGRQTAGDRYQNDQHGLPIDYIGSGEDQRSWRNEREYGRGADAEHEQNWDAQHNRPWDESQELNRERGFERGDQRQRGENRNQPGPFSGVGPQGYRRSDERIKEEVCERLTWHGQIDASKIEVDVKEGEVILRGQVEHKHTKRLAEDVVEKINGVKDVQNQLRVIK